MDASLMMRTGLPSAFSKSNPTQPLPRCFGSLAMHPRAQVTEIHRDRVEFPIANQWLIWAIISRGVNFGPDLNFRFSRRETISFI